MTDSHNLSRFINAQESDYQSALAEITAGRKRSHWMWYIFPQYDGLGFSSTSRHYAIKSPAEAEAYLEHPILGTRLHEYVDAAAYRRNKVRHNDGSSDLEKKLNGFTIYYNSARVHHSLGRATPQSQSGKSSRKPVRLDDYRWQSHCRGLYNFQPLLELEFAIDGLHSIEKQHVKVDRAAFGFKFNALPIPINYKNGLVLKIE
jgi:uncharacterized protein (DUF1810 family)